MQSALDDPIAAYQDSLLLDGIALNLENNFEELLAQLYLGNAQAINSVAQLIKMNPPCHEDLSKIIDAMLICLDRDWRITIDYNVANNFLLIMGYALRSEFSLTNSQQEVLKAIVEESMSFKDFLINPSGSSQINFGTNFFASLFSELWTVGHQLKYLRQYVSRVDVSENGLGDRSKALSIKSFCFTNETSLINLTKVPRLDPHKDLLTIRKWIAEKLKEADPGSDEKVIFVNAYSALVKILILCYPKHTKKLEGYMQELTDAFDKIRLHS